VGEPPDEAIRTQWNEAMEELTREGSYRIVTVPMEERCLTVVEETRRGKNMFALGILAWIYQRDLELVRAQIAHAFRKKSQEVYDRNVELLELGHDWASEHLDFRIDVPVEPADQAMVVMNGNQALALGATASGMELCSMYPITPATSVSHYLADIFESFGGRVHQAEDEIAAAGVAIGASYAGRVAFTVTSGPGVALKTEFLGLAVMAEIPMVLIDVQRGGPSTGLPTKVEQSDLLAALFGQPGDAPKVILAPATIEESFHSVVAARRIAEALRCLVIVLTDANLATGVQPFPRPEPREEWFGAAPDLSPVPDGTLPYDWNQETGLSERIVPGRAGGMHTVTGLSHDRHSRVAYAAAVHQESCSMRSRKLAVFQKTLRPPPLYGDEKGDLLVVGWGSTKGAIEEAVDRAREEGLRVSATHLTFLSPLQPGLREIFGRFARVMTVEINYSDEPDAPYIDEENRRRGQLGLAPPGSDPRGRGLLDPGVRRAPPPRRYPERDPWAPSRRSGIMSHVTCPLFAGVLDEEREFLIEDYEGALARWCSGCGDHAVLAAAQRLLRSEQLAPEKTVFVSGIGCSSRFPHYMKTYGFHGLHGRALPVATGVKLSRPELDVFVVMGDGDCCSIGAGHWIHACGTTWT
jgi:2-oxoglutarate/2-oxoacid ferredoxin oxidoreductase subunit alpha